MNKDVLISIIVPVYNEKKYLDSCINSIISQTYNNLEIIIVDDGSDNETALHCDELKLKDERIKVIHKVNGGLSAARVTGYDNSNGKWIMFVDDDHIISPLMLESFVRFISDDADIVAGKRIDFFDENEINYSDCLGTGVNCIGADLCERIPYDGQRTIITPLWGKIYIKNFLNSIDLNKYKSICPVIFFEDVLMTPILYYKAKKVVLIDEAFYYHREVSTSISRSRKITNFYYNQIYSGIILLDFCKQNQLINYYNYEIKLYVESIIRIYCLMPKNKKYEEDIFLNVKKYKKEYVNLKNIQFKKKLLVRMFVVFPFFVKILLRRFYFNRK